MMKFFGGLGPGGRGNHLEAKKAMVEDLKSRIEEQYLKDVDESIPIQWLTATVARLTLNKITLVRRMVCNATVLMRIDDVPPLSAPGWRSELAAGCQR